LQQRDVPLHLLAEARIIIRIQSLAAAKENGEINVRFKGKPPVERREVLNGMRIDDSEAIHNMGG
jgi:hypothetical protein